jgi:2-polyprenyl-3-methyl-5-hydroxy-6-metoxy-1,4-benzoquinol methylase
MSQQHYAIDGGQQGKERLQLLARVLQPTTRQLFDTLGLTAGMHVLDVGCGGGAVTLELARQLCRQGRVIGLDFDATIIALAQEDARRQALGNVEFRQTDALCLDEPPVYDLVYARFLLTHLADPRRGVAGMVRAAKPGGLVVAEDIDFGGYFCYPPCAAFDRYLDLYTRVVHHKGGDPYIGAKLAGLFLEAGLTAVQVQVIQPVHRLEQGKLIAEVTLERIGSAVIAADLAGADEVADTVAAIAAFRRRPDTLISLPQIFQVWGRRPA